MHKHNIHPLLHDRIEAIAPTLKKLAQEIHANPELGFREQQACRRQVQILRQWKFKVEAPYVKISTAYKASSGRGRPVFCFMAEYDALPKLGHACGHNLIAAAALGAGQALGAVLREEKIPGTVVIMGTPAEEALGGKVKMIRAGALKGLDAAIMAHPSWRTIPDTGSTAVRRYNVNFYGKAAHAAANPEMGLNALDAVMLLFQGINAWRQQLPATSLVHGIITNGGAAPNIIPDLASCFFYLRSTDDQTLKRMAGTFVNVVKGAALMTGTRFELDSSLIPYRARRPNCFLNEAFVEYAGQLGLNPVIPTKSGKGSSDFGDVSQIIPGAHVYFGIAHKPIAGHSDEMREAANSAYGLQQMVRTAEALANVGYRFFTDRQFRESVADAFVRAKVRK